MSSSFVERVKRRNETGVIMMKQSLHVSVSMGIKIRLGTLLEQITAENLEKVIGILERATVEEKVYGQMTEHVYQVFERAYSIYLMDQNVDNFREKMLERVHAYSMVDWILLVPEENLITLDRPGVLSGGGTVFGASCHEEVESVGRIRAIEERRYAWLAGWTPTMILRHELH